MTLSQTPPPAPTHKYPSPSTQTPKNQKQNKNLGKLGRSGVEAETGRPLGGDVAQGTRTVFVHHERAGKSVSDPKPCPESGALVVS